MDDNVSLAVAYYINGVNFRISAEKLSQGMELDAQASANQTYGDPTLFPRVARCGAFPESSALKAWF
jgi:hypothetical protein